MQHNSCPATSCAWANGQVERMLAGVEPSGGQKRRSAARSHEHVNSNSKYAFNSTSLESDHSNGHSNGYSNGYSDGYSCVSVCVCATTTTHKPMGELSVGGGALESRKSNIPETMHVGVLRKGELTQASCGAQMEQQELWRSRCRFPIEDRRGFVCALSSLLALFSHRTTLHNYQLEQLRAARVRSRRLDRSAFGWSILKIASQ